MSRKRGSKGKRFKIVRLKDLRKSGSDTVVTSKLIASNDLPSAGPPYTLARTVDYGGDYYDEGGGGDSMEPPSRGMLYKYPDVAPRVPEIPDFGGDVADRRRGGGHHHSGYGSHHHSGYGYKEEECCPLVFDPLTLFAFLAGIAAATGFLYILVTMNIAGRKRRELTMKNVFLDVVNKGERYPND